MYKNVYYMCTGLGLIIFLAWQKKTPVCHSLRFSFNFLLIYICIKKDRYNFLYSSALIYLDTRFFNVFIID